MAYSSFQESYYFIKDIGGSNEPLWIFLKTIPKVNSLFMILVVGIFKGNIILGYPIFRSTPISTSSNRFKLIHIH